MNAPTHTGHNLLACWLPATYKELQRLKAHGLGRVPADDGGSSTETQSSCCMTVTVSSLTVSTGAALSFYSGTGWGSAVDGGGLIKCVKKGSPGAPGRRRPWST